MAANKSNVKESNRRYHFHIGNRNKAIQALREFINISNFVSFLDIINYLVTNNDIRKKIISEANLEKSIMKKTSANITVCVTINNKGIGIY